MWMWSNLKAFKTRDECLEIKKDYKNESFLLANLAGKAEWF